MKFVDWNENKVYFFIVATWFTIAFLVPQNHQNCTIYNLNPFVTCLIFHFATRLKFIYCNEDAVVIFVFISIWVVYEYGEADTVECDPPEATVVSSEECEEASNFLGDSYMGSGAWPILHGCAAELEDAGNRIWFNENTQGSAKPHRRPVCKIGNLRV